MIERHDEDGVAVVRLAHGKASALDVELLGALDQTFEELESSPAEAVVVTGTGRIFSAGVDLFRVLEGGDAYLDGFLPALSRTLLRVFTFPRPVVAALNGHAIAGGCVLACACDLKIMADGDGTIGVPELRVGVPFPVVALEILRFAVPPQHLQKIAYVGRTYAASEALGWGLVDELVPPEELLSRALAAAREQGATPAGSFAATKHHLRRPALDRIDLLAPELDPRTAELWRSPAIHDHIRDYLERTFGRK